MDFGVVGLDGIMGSEATNSSSNGYACLASSNPETKQKWYGSGFLKQERPVTTEDDWRSSKLSKTESMLLPQRSNTLLKSTTGLFTDGQQHQQQMLSFSCHKPALSVERSTHSPSFPYIHLTSSSAYNKNTGYSSGSFSGPAPHGVVSETRGPFTPSQWMELEHQALIYKYMASNVPIPSNLLFPIKKALESAGFSSFSGGLLRPNTLPWGTFHFGFPGNTDPEPGRCRRTDGKKWRCSRDAVADQKYCERHMNRGRHRSRKPVEGQSGQSAAITTTKAMPAASSSASALLVGPDGSGTPNSLTGAQHHQQLKNLQPVSSSNNPTTASSLGRMFLNKENVRDRSQDSQCLSMLSSNSDLKSKENSLLISKHNSYEQSSRSEFGLVTSDSFLNPSQKSSSLLSCKIFSSSQGLTDQETGSQQSLRQFMDDWPKSQSDRSAVSWSALDVKSDRTQLSISTPVAPTDFMSTTSSPNNEKTNLSPLRLSREYDPIQMGLGVGSVLHDASQRQANWIPISWETSIMAGPLGEVLQNTNNGGGECMNSSALNLMREGWDNSPRLGSSPTGVLQKTVFGSVSNSSAGSSPRAENAKTREGAASAASLCNDILGSTLGHSSSLPAL